MPTQDAVREVLLLGPVLREDDLLPGTGFDLSYGSPANAPRPLLEPQPIPALRDPSKDLRCRVISSTRTDDFRKEVEDRFNLDARVLSFQTGVSTSKKLTEVVSKKQSTLLLVTRELTPQLSLRSQTLSSGVREDLLALENDGRPDDRVRREFRLRYGTHFVRNVRYGVDLVIECTVASTSGERIEEDARSFSACLNSLAGGFSVTNRQTALTALTESARTSLVSGRCLARGFKYTRLAGDGTTDETSSLAIGSLEEALEFLHALGHGRVSWSPMPLSVEFTPWHDVLSGLIDGSDLDRLSKLTKTFDVEEPTRPPSGAFVVQATDDIKEARTRVGEGPPGWLVSDATDVYSRAEYRLPRIDGAFDVQIEFMSRDPHCKLRASLKSGPRLNSDDLNRSPGGTQGAPNIVPLGRAELSAEGSVLVLESIGQIHIPWIRSIIFSPV